MLTKELFEKYLSGDLSAQEQEVVVEYLAQENADHSMLHILLEEFDDESPVIGNYEERDQLLWQLRAKLYPVQEEVAEKCAAYVWIKYVARIFKSNLIRLKKYSGGIDQRKSSGIR